MCVWGGGKKTNGTVYDHFGEPALDIIDLSKFISKKLIRGWLFRQNLEISTPRQIAGYVTA